jgi:adenylate cyclase
MESLSVYLPQDRLQALAHGTTLPDRAHGTALFADVSGFTQLTTTLTQLLGPRRGAEELTRHLDKVYSVLIAEVERYGGSVINFAGDAITCWFNQDPDSSSQIRAVACALNLQAAMKSFATLVLSNDATVTLALKVAIASGPVRRFIVGDPEIQLLDTLAGVTLDRMAAANHLAHQGEVVVDEPTAEILKTALSIMEWRDVLETRERFAVVRRIDIPPAFAPVSTPPVSVSYSDRIRPYLLPAVYERVRAGQGMFLTELRPAVAVFLRFVGIDYDGDDAALQLDTFVRRVQVAARDHGGVLLEITIGDKGSYLYIVFGAPVAHEDDARRAVKTAIVLRDTMEQVQIGVSRGTMRTGAHGGITRRTYGVLGDDVNLAARLMETARPSEIIVSGRIHTAVADDFTLEPRPPLPLKGKAEPLPVFAVTGARQRRAIRLQEPVYSLPMIGREAELQTISGKMELALQGKGQIVAITAEAGMGKSRLVAEVIRLARRRGLVGYGGACQSDGVNTSYLVWRPIWNAFFDLDPTQPLRKQVRALERELEDRAPERVNALPLLGPILGLPLPDNEFTRALEPKYRKSAVEVLMVDCLKAAAHEAMEEGGGLLLVLEDLHWLDTLSHDLLEEIARAIVNLPVLMVLAYRSPELERLQAPRVDTLPHFTNLALQELTTTEAEQAIRAKLAQLSSGPARGNSLPVELARRITDRAQGNPFYIEELLNYLHDQGLDPRDPAALNKIELPDSLHALVLSRIDQLTEGEKTTLKVASVVGRLFRAAWLQGCYPALGEIEHVKVDLEELRRLDITALNAPEPELAYIFKHIVTQEVTYESLAYATRATLHEQLARYLEAAYPDVPLLDLLAYHYGRSENAAKQREYFRRAGDAAQVAYANDVALDYYGRLLPLLTEAGEQIELYLKRGAVLELTGKWNETDSDYRAALSRAETAQNTAAIARCQKALGGLARQRGDYEAALKWLEQARTNWESLGDQDGVSQVVIEMGIVFLRKGDYAEARKYLDEGRTLAQTIGDKWSTALALNHLGNVIFHQGDYETARTLYEESLSLRREVSDKWGISASLNNLGLVAGRQGNHAAAQTLHEESLALKREMGDKWGIAHSLNNLGLAASYQGNYSAAQALCEEGLALRQELGDKRGIVISYFNLGFIAVELGNYAIARAHHAASLQLARDIGHKLYIAYNLAGLAGVVIQVGSEPAISPARAQNAVRLASAAEQVLKSMNGVMEPLERRQCDRTVAAAQTALTEEAFNTAWTEGSNMTLDEAVETALLITVS